MTDTTIMDDGQPDDRRTERGTVHMAARCRSANGLCSDGWLEDISAEGCCLVSRLISFRVESRIVIRPEGLEGITGIVRWVTPTKAGIEFDRPLYPPIVEHLWSAYGEKQPVEFSTD